MLRTFFTSAIVMPFLLACSEKPPKLSPAVEALCADATAIIDGDLKDYAAIGQEGILDDSAIRQGNRLARQQMALTSITIQLEHMRAMNCPAVPTNIFREAYYMPAMKCTTEQLKERLKEKNEKSTACDQSQWKADPLRPPAAASTASAPK